MEKNIKRGTNLRHFAWILGLAVLLVMGNARQASAEVQNKLPYLIKVNRVFNTITIYEKDEAGKYTVPIKAMVCSVGEKDTQTKLGTFQTKAKYRWKELMGKVYGQYSTRIVGGILFHSVYYYENGNPASLATREYNNLGSAASHGCIRLSVEDAKWIYDNCPLGTTVVIYDDKKSPGPLGKPEAIRLPSSVRWDPTDPNAKNPFAAKMPSITGLKNLTVSWGEEVDLRKGVKAKSTVGLDITSKLSVNGEVNPYQSGDYDIEYSVEDALGRTSKKMITVTVKKSREVPVLEGIEDRVIKEGTEVDEAFALKGVKAFCSGVELDPSGIQIQINNMSETEYRVSYSVNVGDDVTAEGTAVFRVDNNAPVISGVTDRLLEEGQVPDKTMALSGVTVSDNYSAMDPEDIKVTIADNPDGGFLVTYAASDDFGNEAVTSAKFYY